MPARATLLRRRAVRKLENGNGSSKSLQKALRILLYMGEKAPEAGVTQLALELGLTKATVHRLLNAMERFELIEKNSESERYRLGLKLYQLGNRAVESRTLRSEARRLLLEISRRSCESVSLAVPTHGGITCLDRVDSAHTIINVCTPVGSMFPAHCTAAGKAILAYMTDSEINEIIKRNPLRPYTQFTITQLDGLKENLRLIRQRGYSVDHQELERGLSGVAAPVMSGGGRIIAAVGIAGPTLRFRGKELAQKVSLATEIAARLNMAMSRLEDRQATPAIAKSPEAYTFNTSQKE